MGMIAAIRRAFSRRQPATLDMDTHRPIRGTYDAASAGGMNTNHWAAADALDADSANSLTVRRRISQRSRYEIGSNGQGKGVQLTQANYVIGRGPKLRLQTKSPGFNAMVEAEWKKWAKEVKLAKKLRTAIKAKVSDGETFIIITQNSRMRNRVKLGLRMVECEQVTTPYLSANEPNKIDGIQFDEYGNPLWYDVLKYHPGSSWSGLNQEAEQVPARYMLHLFREDRAGQHRGVGELAPSLNLFAQGRRFRESTVVAAENVANFSILLKTQTSPYEGADPVRPFSAFPMEKGMIAALPYGLDVFQPRAEQPTATYEEFTRTQSGEQARPINMPNNIARADSSGYSFSGGRLDHHTYFVSVDVEQHDIEEDILDPLLEVWFAEAVLRFGWGVPADPPPNHAWGWQRKPVIDEAKTATARKTDLSSGVGSLLRIAHEDNLDPEDEWPREAALYGITIEELRAAKFRAAYGGGASAEESDGDDDDEPPPSRSRGRNRMASAGARNGNGRALA